jgi:hypothetical protein
MKVEIFVSARKLKNTDIISKSDPKCKVIDDFKLKDRFITRKVRMGRKPLLDKLRQSKII